MGIFPSTNRAFNALSLLVLKFRGRSVAVFRNHLIHYDNILPVAQLHFRALQGVAPEDVVLLAVIPGYPDPGEVELSKEIWSTMSTVVHTVTIALESEMRSSDECSSPILPDYQKAPVESDTGRLSRALSSPISPPIARPPIGPNSGRRPQRYRSGQSDYATQTVAPIPNEMLAPRKPIIYLYPPSSLTDITVELSLTSSWHFSAVYPPPLSALPPGEHQTTTAQSLTWAVAAEPSGALIEKATGTEVSYLYWEATARTQPVTPDGSRATTPIGGIESFDPSRPSVSPGDSILLPIGQVPSYLDEVLKALTLHTEARTSFITFWLPDLLKHEYVALRFLPQASYEQAAQMRISPEPDVVTRVFMLFSGVAPGDVGNWEQATACVTAEDGDATFWARIVGVNLDRALDRSLFRVLEWGGMEIK